ncbi:flippase activity-associated protein Agl23 [Halorhabdus salina]|uniref:flippase activity-associated protein Agl23 n=1 Tax=Halorhabdus salina TaxID=2750670 RepID=UPI0015EFBEFE|nr:flippase activity-associated protein Agl23 [Halorhabdus salina]
MSDGFAAADPAAGMGLGERIRTYVRTHPVVVAVLAVAAIGLLARFFQLGWRVAHWDEARVAYWIDHAFETGHFAYNSHTHGPFIQHADRYLFALFGANDFTARLPVAVIGGLLPLASLLYREHLDDVETVALAALLAANPVLLYYSRFMRSDLLVATFMFTAFGLLVRFYDTRKPRYVYGATALLVFGIASKENAPLYLLTWLGAGALCLDAAFYRPRAYRSAGGLVRSKLAGIRDQVHDGSRSLLGWLLYYGGHGLAVAALFIALFVFMFAPRGGGMAGMLYPPSDASATLGLWEAVTAPWKLPELVADTFAYVVYPEAEYFQFGGLDGVVLDLPGPPEVSGTSNTVPYLERLGSMTEGLFAKSFPLLILGAIGFLRERYAAAKSRTLVLFMTYAGVASWLGYPLTFSIGSGWKWGMTHTIVPLAIPAAVGLGVFGRWAIDAIRQDDRIEVGFSAVVIGFIAVLVVSTAVAGAYGATARSEDNPLVQYGQPGDDLRPALEQIQHISPVHDGTDVLIYDGSIDDGGSFVKENASTAHKDFRPVCTVWGNTLPINWYLAAYDTETACAANESTLRDSIDSEEPVPVVVVRENDNTVPESAFEAEYYALTYELRTSGSEATFYIHEDWWNAGQ